MNVSQKMLLDSVLICPVFYSASDTRSNSKKCEYIINIEYVIYLVITSLIKAKLQIHIYYINLFPLSIHIFYTHNFSINFV